jgi:signal transduction histidine kinase/CheY-like chemotaxis protein
MSIDLAAVLDLSGELQRATTLGEVLAAAQAAIVRDTRYRTSWTIAVEDVDGERWLRILAMEGAAKDLVWERAPRFPLKQDPFLLEILSGDHPVVVEDMRNDPRTDKEIVSRTDHRTAVCVPMRLGRVVLGALCVGSFGAEGVVPPTPTEVESLTVTTTLVTAAYDRVRLLARANAADAEAHAQAERSRALEAQLRHSQRLEAVGQLAGGIAHDFNNLLTAIAGHAELALEERPAPAAEESLRVILQATRRGSHLTHNLLSFSRRRVLTPRVTDLGAAARHACALVRPALRSEVDLRVVADAPIYAEVDEVEVEHALINLVTNARDAIDGSGTITITVGTTTVSDTFLAEHGGRLLGTCAIITVTDSGHGMDADTLARAFEPFFSTKSVGRGTGLGLATVRSIVDQHAGVVTATSTPGRGTTFTIHLPLAPAPTELPGPEVGALASTQSARGETILLAEDDQLVRELLTRVLEGQGYRVIVAEDGHVAIQQFREHSAEIDLVLTDLMMPRRSGLELVDAVRVFHQGTPIVVMSGYTSDPAGAARITALGLPVLDKPVTPTAVLLRIRQVLTRARANRARSSAPTRG